VFDAAGELRHWSEGAKPSLLLVGGKRPRDDPAGLYEIGEGATINLTNVHPIGVWTLPDDPSHLFVQVDENTTLQVVEQTELPEEEES
jgi:hypothetical protein